MNTTKKQDQPTVEEQINNYFWYIDSEEALREAYETSSIEKKMKQIVANQRTAFVEDLKTLIEDKDEFSDFIDYQDIRNLITKWQPPQKGSS